MKKRHRLTTSLALLDFLSKDGIRSIIVSCEFPKESGADTIMPRTSKYQLYEIIKSYILTRILYLGSRVMHTLVHRKLFTRFKFQQIASWSSSNICHGEQPIYESGVTGSKNEAGEVLLIISPSEIDVQMLEKLDMCVPNTFPN